MLISDDEMRKEMSPGCDCSQQDRQSVGPLVAEQMPVWVSVIPQSSSIPPRSPPDFQLCD